MKTLGLTPVALQVFWPLVLAASAWLGHDLRRWIVCAILTVAAGGVQIFRAKLPVYRQRRFFTFGPGVLPESSLNHYWQGWRLVASGTLAATLILGLTAWS